MTRLLSLPNEILIAIAASVVDPRDVAALALTNGRLFSIANPALYAAAAQHSRHTRRALFYSAENGFINSVRRLLSHGVNPNVIYVAPVPRDCLHHVLAAQGRRPGRQPLIDRRLALDAIQVTLRGTERETGLSEAYRALLSTVFADTDSKPDLADTISLAYSFLIYELQILVTQTDRVFNPITPDAETQADSTSVWDTDNMFQWTALHVAAQRGDNELVELLLDSGAAVDPLLRHRESVPHMGVLEGIFGSSLVPPAFETPLHLAISAGHDSTAHLLLASGASAATGYRGVTALHIAAWHGALELCRVMVDGDASLVDARTGTQLTPFHYAVAAGHLQTVGRFLLDRGADMRALLNARVSERAGGMQQIWMCNAFTHALLARRYSDALMLLAMDPELAVPGRNDLHPIQACLLAPNLCESDEDQMVPILRRLLLRDGAHADPLMRRLFSRCLKETAAKHLPQAWRLLLETAEDSASRNLTFNDWVTEALRGTQSIASSWTLTQLLHRVVSAQGISMPGIVSVFPPGFVHAIHQAKVDIARRLNEPLAATPEGVDDLDLRGALLGVCQPDALEACEWLASLGAVRHLGKDDFVSMLSRTAVVPAYGGSDAELARWVLLQADSVGLRGQVLASSNILNLTWGPRAFTVAQVLVREGASLTPPYVSQYGIPPPNHRYLFSCYTRRPLALRGYNPEVPDHVLLMACSKPDLTGAVELLRLVIGRLGEDANDFVNSALVISDGDHEGELCTPAGLLCCSTNMTEPNAGEMPSEPARLAMLRMLLDAGAEVHTLVERVEGPAEGDLNSYDTTQPSEPLWRALASQDESEIIRQQETSTPVGAPPRWKAFSWQHAPIRCAIRSRMPSLVRAMLAARPLPTRNSLLALRYLRIACGEARRPSPEILEILLGMANLDHADIPVKPTGETALMVLLAFYAADDFESALPPHECRCEDDLIGDESHDLTKMVRLLLARGARWDTAAASGRSALDELRDALVSEMRAKFMYKQHNLGELRKHVVPDLYSEAAQSAGFNPFKSPIQ